MYARMAGRSCCWRVGLKATQTLSYVKVQIHLQSIDAANFKNEIYLTINLTAQQPAVKPTRSAASRHPVNVPLSLNTSHHAVFNHNFQSPSCHR